MLDKYAGYMNLRPRWASYQRASRPRSRTRWVWMLLFMTVPLALFIMIRAGMRSKHKHQDVVELRNIPEFPEYLHDLPERIPSSVPYTAAIVYLSSWRRAGELITSLSYLHDNLPTKYPWPIMLFHPGDFDSPIRQKEFQRRLFEYMYEKGVRHEGWRFIDRIQFVRLDFELPEGVPNNVHVVDPIYPNKWPGYHHMCYFYTSQIFDHPRLQNITYYMRIDTDGALYDKACYDPFERMYKKDLIYGYRIFDPDLPEYVRGMYKLVEDYSALHPETRQNMLANGWVLPDPETYDEEKFPQYYNNFEVVKMDAFRTPEIRAWFKEINSDPMRFYRYRWGDAPLRYATINMFYNESAQVELFCGIPYKHVFVGPRCGCESD